MTQVKTPSRRTSPAEVAVDHRCRSAIPAGPPGVLFVQYGTDPDGVDPVEQPRRVQCREDDGTGAVVAGHQDRRGVRPLGARDDLRRDVHQAAGDAEVRQPATLREAHPVQPVVPERGDHGGVAAVGRKAEIAAPQIDGRGRRGAEPVGHPPRAVDVTARDRQRQCRVPSAQEGGGPRARLARTTQDQYRFRLSHCAFPSRQRSYVL
ncbi:hypothetical protein [Streptomyces sp. wa1002]|uniref:hypothetical protein n=1 Tax=Streptomyces sp. wa1002 TaxID=1828186 RepID=UPI00211D31D6|nr:hypothetical protein [Streptomyces sp. wa1002]